MDCRRQKAEGRRVHFVQWGGFGRFGESSYNLCGCGTVGPLLCFDY